MTERVQGVIARSKGAPVELVDVDVPDPGPGEARVRVQAREPSAQAAVAERAAAGVAA